MGVFRSLLILLLMSVFSFADLEWRVENSNFTLSQVSLVPQDDMRYTYNYNRLRVRGDWKESALFITAIGDAVNYIGKSYIDSLSFAFIKELDSDTPFKTQSAFAVYAGGKAAAHARLYRLYGGYDDGKNRIVAGLQNITMGIGHIWTPSNLFNPINTYALEPDETYGVVAVTATHYIDNQSQLYAVASQREDGSYKYAAGVKMTIGIVDLALNGIKSDDTKMLGYTVERDLWDTGVQLRSEGAWINASIDTPSGLVEEREFFQGIIGADYAFQQGLNLTVEALYSSERFSYEEIITNLNSELRNDMAMSHFYLGATLYYDFTIYLSGALVAVESFGGEHSRFVSPSLSYTMNDNNTFTLGAQINSGGTDSEFGMFGNTYYLKYTLSY